MRKFLAVIVCLIVCLWVCGCSQQVPPGTLGRINTRDGWSPDILKPGYHTCFGWDSMYLLNVTNKSFSEKMEILVGGKVNLTVNFTTRVHANTEDVEAAKRVFETVPATYDKEWNSYAIRVDDLYETFLKMKALAVPRMLFEVQPDVQTAVGNSPALAAEFRKQITEIAKSTPLVVEDAQITNYDWPKSITEAQEELMKVKLLEEAAAAKVRAALKQAEGQLKVEEANKLVELKRAEAVAESIDIIKRKLADAPEYLMWHQIRVMGEAANGPNNAFILYPYATDASQVRSMLGNAGLTQMLGESKK